MEQVFSAPRVVADAALLAPGGIVVRNGRVHDVFDGRPPAGEHNVELASGTLAPGFLDLQINGYGGADFATADGRDWVAPARGLAAQGVTSFLPTLITAPVERLTEGIRRVIAAGRALEADGTAAQVAGVHVEGPFLSAAYRGAHNAQWLVSPTPEDVDALLAAADGTQLLVTLAPELEGALDAIRRLSAGGALASVGHSGATADCVAAAVAAGARKVTHLFNAQRGLHHREPGVVGAALTDSRLVSGLILDLHHVAAPVARIAFAAAPERIALVSDAVAAAGMPPGRYALGGETIRLGPDGPPLRADGTIAGANLSLSRAVANAVALGVDLVSAVRAASTIPADLIGREDLGRLTPGARADLVWLSDELEPRATWIRGALAHGGGALPRAAAPRARSSLIATAEATR